MVDLSENTSLDRTANSNTRYFVWQSLVDLFKSEIVKDLVKLNGLSEDAAQARRIAAMYAYDPEVYATLCEYIPRCSLEQLIELMHLEGGIPTYNTPYLEAEIRGGRYRVVRCWGKEYSL